MGFNSLNYSVSVVIPVYNSGLSAVESIRSVLAQSYPISEIVVVDDGSSDDSLEILDLNFKNNPLVTIYSQENSGAGNARTYGAMRSSADLVAFLDSDDCWISNKIELQVAFFMRDLTIGLVGSLTNMRGNYSLINLDSNYRQITVNNLIFKNYFQTSTVLIKNNVLRDVGYFPLNRRYGDEGDLFIRIAAKYKCILLNQVLVDYAHGKAGFAVSGISSHIFSMEFYELVNLCLAFKRKNINFFYFMNATTFSILKFVRRLLIYFKKRIIS